MDEESPGGTMSAQQVKEWLWCCNSCGCAIAECDCPEPDLVYVWRYVEQDEP